MDISKIKAIVFDLDGIINITENESGYVWKQTREQDLGISNEILDGFFMTSWKPVVLGKIDMHTQLSEYLSQYELQDQTNRVISYFVEKNTNVDKKVLGLITQMNIPVYIGSDIDPERFKHFWEDLDFKSIFKEGFTSSKLHVKKSSPEFFNKAQEIIGLSPENILFMDDDLENVEVAQQCRWQGYHYTGFNDKFSNIIIQTSSQSVKKDPVTIHSHT